MKWGWIVPFARDGEFWRQSRKLLDRGLRPRAIMTYNHVQQAKANVLLTKLLTNPDEVEAHLESFVVFLSVLLGFPKCLLNYAACQEN